MVIQSRMTKGKTMAESATYMFSDVWQENAMVLGPGGISWIPCLSLLGIQFSSAAFRVQGANNAKSFAAWLRNTMDCYVVPVMVCTQDEIECS